MFSPNVRAQSYVRAIALALSGRSILAQAQSTTNLVAPYPAFATAAPAYAPKEPVAGELHFVGSRTLGEIVALWSRGFKRIHPDSKLVVETAGTETALEVLTADKPSLALFSRPPTTSELKQIEQRTKLSPLPLVVGKRVLTIVVHRENPLERISRKQLQTAFQAADKAVTWGDLGATGEFAKKPVVGHGCDEESGARNYILHWVLGPDGKARKFQEHTTHTLVVQAIAADQTSLGYAAETALTDQVKPLAIQEEALDPGSFPDDADVASGRYPLVPELYLVVLRKGDEPLSPLATEFLRYVFSRSGQLDLIKDGFLPLSRPELNAQRDKLGWSTSR